MRIACVQEGTERIVAQASDTVADWVATKWGSILGLAACAAAHDVVVRGGVVGDGELFGMGLTARLADM